MVAHIPSGHFVLRRGQTEWTPVPVYPTLGQVRSSWIAPSDSTRVYAATADGRPIADGTGTTYGSRAAGFPNALGIAWQNPFVAYATTGGDFLQASEI